MLFGKSLKTPEFWLLGIAATLVAIHLTLLSRTNRASYLGMSAVFWAVVACLVWRKRDNLNLKSDFLSTCLGVLLIAFGLFKGLSLSGYDPFLRILPLIDALGLCLLASGIRGIWQYWQELLCLSFLALPASIVSRLFNPDLLTAKFSAFTLWYLGFDVSRQGTNIMLPTGSVNVGPTCTGLSSMIQLLGLAIAFLLLFPLSSRFNQILVPLVAVALAFMTNGVRVAMLAVLAAPGHREAFDYWHTEDGSLAFSLLAVMLFGLFCLFLIRREVETVDSEQ